MACSSDSSKSSSSTPTNKVLCKIGGASKTLSAQATKTNTEIDVVATLTSAKSAGTETIQFVAYENELATKIYDFTYVVNGETYTPETETDLSSSFSQKGNGKLVGSFSGTVKNSSGQALNITGGTFNIVY